MRKNKRSVHAAMIKEIDRLDRSDDFWLAYAIASLELENNYLAGESNAQHLSKLLEGKLEDLEKCRSSQDFVDLANELALGITPGWHQDSLPVASLSEKIHYVRDLILLKFVYDVSKN